VSLVVETFDDIGVTRISRWIFNCYLVHDGGGGQPVVIDPGLPGLVDDLVPVLSNLGLAITDLEAIYATHAHSDHVAGIQALAARSGADVHLPVGSRPYFEGQSPRSPSVGAVASIWPALLDQPFDRAGAVGAARGARLAGYGSSGPMRWPTETRPGFLVEGESLSGAPAWQMIATPGHTDDSVAFWHPQTRTLLSGDAVLSLNGRAWMTSETVDDDAHAKTEMRLRDLAVDHLLPGHGRPVHGEQLTARAWAPKDAPKGSGVFASGLKRCFGRIP